MGLTKSQRQARADIALLREATRSGTFLFEWLEESTQAKKRFTDWSATLSADECEATANSQGFRTWRAYVACISDKHRALELFAGSPVFAAIWRALKECDPQGDWLPWGFSPANGGVPIRILRAIQNWHETPKFTVAESARHYKKVADSARKLIELLEQVSPGGFTQAFDLFDIDENEADRLLSSFRTPDKYLDIYQPHGSSSKDWTASTYLQRAGITPLWALKKIQAASSGKKAVPVLPRKVRAKTAYRTFMIGEVAQALASMGPRSPLPVGDQMIADAVALLINADCSLDDVRKALSEWRAEDSRAESR